MRIVTTVYLVVLFGYLSIAQANFAQQYCDLPGFYCVKVLPGQTWRSLWPDENDRQLIKTLNRRNLVLRPGMNVAIPESYQNSDPLEFAPFVWFRNTSGERLLVINQHQHAWGAYDNSGKLIRWGALSAGKDFCKDTQQKCRTVSGVFRVFRKEDDSCRSSQYPIGQGGAPMPYCMFFYRGFAIHGSNQVPGYHASHGCIRVFHEDARWLNRHFIELNKTTVLIQKIKPKVFSLEN